MIHSFSGIIITAKIAGAFAIPDTSQSIAKCDQSEVIIVISESKTESIVYI